MENPDDIILEAFATDLGPNKGEVFRMLSSDWQPQREIVEKYTRRKLAKGSNLKNVVMGIFYELEVIMILSSLEQQDDVIEGKSEELKGSNFEENVIYFRRKTVDELANAFAEYVPPPKSLFNVMLDKIRSLLGK